MKAISLKQPWASAIAWRPRERGYLQDQAFNAQKTIETRTWPTKYRGEILIVASKWPLITGLPAGEAVCIARLVDCRTMTKDDEFAAQCGIYPGAWAWVFEDIRPVEPFAVRGQLGIYEVELPGAFRHVRS